MAAWLKIGLGVGAGVAIGAAALYILAKKSPAVRKGVVTALSYGIDLKDKMAQTANSAKEEMEMFVEEAKTQGKKRAEA